MSGPEYDLTAVIVAGAKHGTDLRHWPAEPLAALDRLIKLTRDEAASLPVEPSPAERAQ